MKKHSKVFVLLALSLGLAACMSDEPTTPDVETPDTEQEVDEQEPDNSEETDPDNGEMDPELVEFDEQIEDTIEIEGMEEPITLNLYDNPDAIFLTYVPEDLLAEEGNEAEGESYKFHANFEGERLEDINLEVYLFADDVTEEPSLEDEDSIFAMKLGDMEEASAEDKWYDWSIKEFHSPERSRHAMLGEHNGRYFVMIFNSTALYSEGFGPRARKVIEHFYWKDTNEYLVQE